MATPPISRMGCMVMLVLALGGLVLLGWALAWWVPVSLVVLGLGGLFLFNRRLSKPEAALSQATRSLEMGQLDMAEMFYGRLMKPGNDPQFRMAASYGMTVVPMLKGSYEASIDRLNQMMSAVDEMGASAETAHVRAPLMARRGLCLALMGRVDEAREVTRQVKQMTRQMDGVMLLLDAVIAARTGSPRAAAVLVQGWEAEVARMQASGEAEGVEPDPAWMRVMLRMVELFALWELHEALPESTREEAEEVSASASKLPGLVRGWPDAQAFMVTLQSSNSDPTLYDGSLTRAVSMPKAVGVMSSNEAIQAAQQEVVVEKKSRKPKRSLNRASSKKKRR